MARKVIQVKIDKPGRDFGKRFEITELPASQAEEWAMRAFLALSASGMEIPDDVAQAGLAGIATIGLRALGKIPWELAKPLMDEMMTCVRSVQERAVRDLIEDDIEEVSTRLELRRQVLALHTDFFTVAGPSTSDPAKQGAA